MLQHDLGALALSKLHCCLRCRWHLHCCTFTAARSCTEVRVLCLQPPPGNGATALQCAQALRLKHQRLHCVSCEAWAWHAAACRRPEDPEHIPEERWHRHAGRLWHLQGAGEHRRLCHDSHWHTLLHVSHTIMHVCNNTRLHVVNDNWLLSLDASETCSHAKACLWTGFAPRSCRACYSWALRLPLSLPHAPRCCALCRAPEVCTSQAYTFKSDLWSLGCVLYELCMLT